MIKLKCINTGNGNSAKFFQNRIINLKSKMVSVLTFLLFFFNYVILFGQSDALSINLLSGLPKGTEIAIGIYNQGEIQKYGYLIKKNNLVQTNNAHKLFEIGSITKVFTTLSALRILNKYQIGLHSSIYDLIP